MSTFEEIAGSFPPDAVSYTIIGLVDEWEEEHPGESVSDAVEWTIEKLRGYFGSGLFDLFLEAAWDQARYVQPGLEETLRAPVAVALRSAIEDIGYFRERREQSYDATLEALRDAVSSPERTERYRQVLGGEA